MTADGHGDHEDHPGNLPTWALDAWRARPTSSAPPPSFTVEPPRHAASRRYKIWQIPGTVQCSIVGTCLDRGDIAALIRKGGLRVQRNATDYQVHGYFVQEATQPGPIGQLIHKTLDRKYAPQVARVARLRDAEALKAYWDDACAKGQVAGPYWALMSHRHVGERLRNAAFGDVHMLSHVMGGVNRSDAQALWAAERRVAELEARLDRVRRGAQANLAERDARIAALEGELQQLRATCTRLELARTTRPERAAAAAKQERRRRQQERRLAAARARLREQDREIAALRAQIRQLEDMPLCPLPRPAAPSAEAEGLCPARLLYVGGRASAVPHLRDGAARRSAEFLHHDGGFEHSLQQLHDLVGRADLVVCPVDCVSHGACGLARDLCKRANKPFVPLKSASLSHFRRLLDRLGVDGAPRPVSGSRSSS